MKIFLEDQRDKNQRSTCLDGQHSDAASVEKKIAEREEKRRSKDELNKKRRQKSNAEIERNFEKGSS